MARNYSLNGKNTAGSTTTPTTAIELHGATAARTWVYDLTLGSVIAPADYATQWDLKRYTAAGTVTSQNPVSLDPVNIASVCTGSTSTTGVNATAEPTYSGTTDTVASLIVIPLNARATFRYVASPGAEFVNVLTTGNGLGLRQSATTAIVGVGTLIFFE